MKFGLKTVGVLLVSVMLLTAFVSYRVWSNPGFSGRDIYLDDLPSVAQYVINTDGTYVWATRYDGDITYSGSDAATVIQSALDALTSGRTWKERIVLKGSFDLNKKNITIPSYTIVDGLGCKLQPEDGLVYDVDWAFFNNSASAHDIEVRNIIFDENYAGSPDEWAWFLDFSGVANLTVSNCVFKSPQLNYAVDLDGDDVFFENNRLYGAFNVRLGDSTDSSKTAYVKNNYFEDCRVYLRRMSVFDSNELYDLARVCAYGDKTQITNNHVLIPYSTTGITIFSIDGADYAKISDNFVLSDNTHIGIVGMANYPKNLGISNNFFHGGSTIIQTTSNCHNVTIYGNIIENATKGMILYDYVDNAWIEGNIIRNNDYGIYIVAGTKTWTITNNKLYGNTDDIYWDDLLGTVIFRRNFGFVTENSGNATIASGETIAHGIDSSLHIGQGNSTVLVTPYTTVYDSVPVVVGCNATDSTNITITAYWVNGTEISDDAIDIWYYVESR